MTHWDKLRLLPLTIDAVSSERYSMMTPAGFERVSTVLVLSGGEYEGRGEELAYSPDEQALFEPLIPTLPLTGEWTLESFCEHAASLDLFGAPAADPNSRQPWYRQWTFESAALDLALRQAHTNLAEILNLDLAPVRFCTSMGLGSPPSTERVEQIQHTVPTEWKLDVTNEWSPDLVERIGQLDGVAVIDIKAHYSNGFMDDLVAPPDLLKSLVDDLPEHVLLEDAPLTPEALEALGEQGIARLSWDAPIHSWDDVEALPHPPAALNIKPSRLGSIRELLRVVTEAQSRNIALYSGGQFELSVGRAQIQELASIFYPSNANDCAPVAYHETTIGSSLPTSPLEPGTPAGFGGAFARYL